MPTKSEFGELIKKCKWKWGSIDGNRGNIVTGPNGNSIFFPAAGRRLGTSLEFVGNDGEYWSPTSYDGDKIACYLYFAKGYRDRAWGNRSLGLSVRAVSE